MALKLNDENISLIINNIEDTLNLLIYQNNNYYQKYDENLSNFFYNNEKFIKRII